MGDGASFDGVEGRCSRLTQRNVKEADCASLGAELESAGTVQCHDLGDGECETDEGVTSLEEEGASLLVIGLTACFVCPGIVFYCSREAILSLISDYRDRKKSPSLSQANH